MKVFKRFSLGFLAVFLTAYFLAFLLFVVLYLYDPLMFFHKPYFREQSYHNDMRLAARGIIDYAEFDSVILGTSMLENTLAKEADIKLKGKWLNLALNSARIYEREMLLQHLFKHKKIKQVIYTLESYFLVKGEFSKEPNFKPLKLEYSFFDKIKTYLNKHFISCALKWSKEEKCVGGKKDLNVFATWYNESSLGFHQWGDAEKKIFFDELQIYEQNAYKEVHFDEAKIQKYIQEHILLYVRQNPQLEFHFILPTQSRFFHKIPYFWNDKRSPEQYFDNWQKMVKWFVRESSKYQNAKIYGFDDLEYADNLNNYTDARHYNVDMNSMHLDAIAQQSHILTTQNIDEYFNTLQDKIKNYDIKPFIKDIKAWHEAYSKKKN